MSENPKKRYVGIYGEALHTTEIKGRRKGLEKVRRNPTEKQCLDWVLVFVVVFFFDGFFDGFFFPVDTGFSS